MHKNGEQKESGQDSASYMRHLKGVSLHVRAFMRGRTERRDARGKGDAVAPELSLWTKSMPKRTQQDAKKREEVRQSGWLMVIGVVVSHPLSMRETLDSIPTWSITKCWEECRRRTEKMRKWAGFSFIHETPKRREPACMFIYGEMDGKYGFSFIHETPKRREPACMFIYEETHGKDEKVGRIQLHTWDTYVCSFMGRCTENMDSASYMRHLKGESLHVWAFTRRCTEKMS